MDEKDNIEERTIEVEATVVQPVEEQVSLIDVDVLEEMSAAVNSVRNGKAAICFITAGQGESGYYSKEVLKEAVPLFKDKPMYVDHEQVKPRALYWVGDINSVRYEESGIDGPGLYGVASVQPRWRSFVEGMLDSKGGVSIRARGKSDEHGTVRSITSVGSVDYVVRAGRGGRIMSLLESALVDDELIIEEEDNMSDKENIEEVTTKVEEVVPTTKVEEVVKVVEAKVEDVKPSGLAESDMAVLVEKFSKVMDEKIGKFESRLKLVERESSDRETVKRIISEGFGEGIAEEARTRIESIIWESRGDAENLEEHCKSFVESLKPIFDGYKKVIEDEYAEKYKDGKVAPPSILGRISEAREGIVEDTEVTEAELEKELASSIAGFIAADNKVDRVQEIIIDNKVGV